MTDETKHLDKYLAEFEKHFGQVDPVAMAVLTGAG
jgi:hypothetical protein